MFVNGEIIEADRGITYTFNGVLGSPQSPYVLDLTPRPSFTGITVKYSEGKRIAVFDGTSEETISIPESFDVDCVEYDRYFVPNQYAAVILPFDISSSTNFTGGSFFKFTDVIRENEKWVATMTKVNELKANLPYLFLPSDEQLVFDFNGQPVMLKTEVVDPGSKNGWTFRGTYQKLVWTDESTDYGFSAKNPDDNIKREFVRFSDGDYILPLRCYLSYTGPYVPFCARRYAEAINLPDIVEIRLLDENGKPYGGVGIYTIKHEKRREKSEDEAYDLSGRKVNSQFSTSFLANGDIAVVKRFRNERQLYGFRFADATLRFPDYDNLELDVTVLLDTLQSEAPALTRQQHEQLFNSVWEDYPEIRDKRERMKRLRQDPYYNALQIKYAYAVTCHKAQGGQWQHVYIDQGYINEEMLTPDYFRWLYTALTRATEKVFLVNWPKEQIE